MPQAADTMNMYDVVWSGRHQCGLAIIQLALLLLRCCCRSCRLACCQLLVLEFFLRCHEKKSRWSSDCWKLMLAFRFWFLNYAF